MKFLSRVDPMTVLMLVVIFGVVITMSAQIVKQAPVSKVTVQVVPVDSIGLALVKSHPGES